MGGGGGGGAIGTGMGAAKTAGGAATEFGLDFSGEGKLLNLYYNPK